MKDSNKKQFYKKVTKEDMAVYGKPSVVKVVNNQIELAIKLWKRKLKDSGQIELLKERKEYIKPSTKKRKQKQQAKRSLERKRMFDN
jgi:ribosomal protein S21